MLALSCQKYITKEEMTSYLNDPENGLKQEITHEKIKVSVVYRPTELIVKQQNSEEEEFEKRRVEYDKYHYFILSLSEDGHDVLYKGRSNQAQFSESLNRINFQLPMYLCALGDKKDTISLADYYVPNFYGMGGSTQIMLAFPNEKKYKTIEIRLKEMGLGIGEQKFLFKEKDIKKIPKLITTVNS
jgi:hypothetical protein